MGKTNFLLPTLPFSPKVVLATRLLLGILRKYRENELNTRFKQKFGMSSYGLGK
jgi:hypothetical protein